MVKWTYNPPEDPLKFHIYQDAFWKARRLRICKECHIEFSIPPDNRCPKCQAKGLRKFHRLTMLSGRRGGKTKTRAIAGAEEASIPKTIGWACAPTNPKLHRYVIPAFQEIINAEVV